VLPRNPDGSLQYDEHTSIAPEAAEGLLQRLREAKTASQKVVNLCKDCAPIEQIVKADAAAMDAWLRYEGDKRRASERLAEETKAAADKMWQRAVAKGYAAHDHPSFFVAPPEIKSELDMLQEGCPHHDPVDEAEEEDPTCYSCGGTPEACTCTAFYTD
jgi:hypothetical protein